MEKIGTRKIETERLILRRFTIEDASAMYERWASDPEVTKYLSWQRHESLDVSRAIIGEWLTNYERGDYFNWAIELKDVGVIGSIGEVTADESREEIEIGYCIAKEHWGKGITAEALKAVLTYLFDRAHFRKVIAKHDVENPNSGRVMEKAGMKCEGILRRGGRNNRGEIDVNLYVMRREDRDRA